MGLFKKCSRWIEQTSVHIYIVLRSLWQTTQYSQALHDYTRMSIHYVQSPFVLGYNALQYAFIIKQLIVYIILFTCKHQFKLYHSYIHISNRQICNIYLCIWWWHTQCNPLKFKVAEKNLTGPLHSALCIMLIIFFLLIPFLSILTALPHDILPLSMLLNITTYTCSSSSSFVLLIMLVTSSVFLQK